MTILDFYSLIIPGYETLSEEIKLIFESSPSGKLFIELARDLLVDFEKLEASSHWWNSIEKRKQKLYAQFECDKEKLINKIKNSEEYEMIIFILTQKILSDEITEFKWLSPEHQEFLSQTEFAQSFCSILAKMNKQILSGNTGKGSLDDLQKQKEETISLWKKQLMESSEWSFLKNEIEKKQHALLEEHVKELSLFFPLLNYRKQVKEEPIINQLRAKYFEADGDLIAKQGDADKEKLADLLFYCMREVSAVEIDFIDLDSFNQKQAEQMAVAILKAFDNTLILDLDQCFKEYEIELNKYILEELKLINNKSLPLKTNELSIDSLSFLWKNPATDKANKFLKKLADAHGFIQATGFSTQNENSFLAILDIYNYARYQEQISDARTILFSLLTPFYPLLNEYKDIAFYEKNNFWKLFRTVMPLIVTVTFIILIATVLVPLVLPDIAFFAAFIPSLLIGLGFATEYVDCKNTIYNSLRQLYYGGPFEIPEFQVNTRLLTAFGTETNAQSVRAFYIEELMLCDELEANLSLKHQQGILNQEGIDQRKANREKRYQLCLEWYDIHSNKDLSYNQASVIILNRLRQAIEQEHQQFQKIIKEERPTIAQAVTEVSNDIKATIMGNNKTPTDETEVVEKEAIVEAPIIKTSCRYGLFSHPEFLKPRAHLEYLDRLCEQLSASS